MRTALRAVVAATVLLAGGITIVPRDLPPFDPAADTTVHAPMVTTFALRLLGAGLCAYLGLILVAVVLAELRLLPTALRRAVDRRTGAGLAGTVRHVVAPSALALGLLPFTPVAAYASEAPPVLAPIDERGNATDPGVRPPPTRTGAPTMAPTPGPRAATPPVTAPTNEDPPSVVAVPPAPGPEPARHPSRPAHETVTARPGDSFWTIAEDLVVLATGRAPSDLEVVGPWLELIEANRHRLPDPANPDLLLPGTVLTLPPSA